VTQSSGGEDRPAWERRDGEPAPAFGAFVIYRDLGPQRSIDEVARRLSGHQEGTKRAPGRLKKWSVDYSWAERSQAYDRHLDAERLAAAREAERARAAKWVERRDKGLEDRYLAASLAVERAKELLRFPVQQLRVEQGGKVQVLEPLGADTLRKATSALREASAVMDEAVAEGLRLSAGQAERADDPAGRREVQDEAARELEQWRAAQREKIASWQSASRTPPT
jgi:hypothetical protein